MIRTRCSLREAVAITVITITGDLGRSQVQYRDGTDESARFRTPCPRSGAYQVYSVSSYNPHTYGGLHQSSSATPSPVTSRSVTSTERLADRRLTTGDCQKSSFAASCTLNGSPEPIPGALVALRVLLIRLNVV